jgi:streptomycin 6-kinase
MSDKLRERVEERIRDWRIVAQDTLETPGSFIVYGTRGNQPVVLKVMRQPGDEWRCGEVLDAFNGMGMVKVYEYVEGAVLLERLHPGTSLAAIALDGRDEEATETLTEVIRRMSQSNGPFRQFATVEDWGKGFQRYLASGDHRVPKSLVEQGQNLYVNLCASQQARRLLHGDLQHYNILFDSQRGWTAIDPKGVVGEVEYEIGAGLRNPYEEPALFASPEKIEVRLKHFENRLKIDFKRALQWGFAQAVLSAIWTIEDGFELDPRNPSIRLANAMRPMLE